MTEVEDKAVSAPTPPAPPPGVGGWVRTALSAVGLRSSRTPPATPAPTDLGTRLAMSRTDFALDRTFLAAERTLMAWVRTSLSMISFGFTIVKVLEAFQKGQQIELSGPLGFGYSPATLGLALITLGTLSLVAAVLQHRWTLTRLRARGLQPRWSLALMVASVMAVLGVFAFGSIALRF